MSHEKKEKKEKETLLAITMQELAAIADRIAHDVLVVDASGLLKNTTGKEIREIREINEIEALSECFNSMKTQVLQVIQNVMQIIGQVRDAIPKVTYIVNGYVRAPEVDQYIDEHIVCISEQVVEVLDGLCKEIGHIVCSVSIIAGRLNLFGLNAVLEAARAKNGGHGFDAVSEEMSIFAELAEQSKLAAKQISALINDIQHLQERINEINEINE